MSAETSRWTRWKPPTFTISGLTFGILVALFALPLALLQLSGLGDAWLALAYLAFAAGTAAVLRSVRQEPGSWLGRRAVRRGLVIMIASVCAALVASTTLQLEQVWALAMLLLVVLILLNVALGRATQRVATAPDQAVDERQETLRNRAHHLAYWIFALAVGGVLVLADTASPQSRSWLENGLYGVGWLALVELLFVLPSMVLAWLEPDRLAPEDPSPATAAQTRLSLAMLALAIVAPFLLSLGVIVLPAHTTSSMITPPLYSAAQAERCTEFTASTEVGRGASATIPVHAVACWDGRHAYERWGLNDSDCHIARSVLTMATPERCTRTSGPDGRLHFTYRVTVRPALLPFLGRDVDMELVLDRDGHVERFP